MAGFRRFVNAVQLLALVGAAFFVVMLFAYRPSTGGTAPNGNAATGAGAQVFAANCARCHGAGGEGGIGPRLAGRVAGVYSDPAAEVTVVKEGRGGMPSFAGALSDDQIRQVVDYTRTL